LISLASGAVLGHAVAACKGKGTGEQPLLRGLLPLIVKGDILLADALLATWWIVAEAQRRGGHGSTGKTHDRLHARSAPGPERSCG